MNLDEYLFRHKISKTEFAKLIGVSRTYIHDIIARRRTPRPPLAKKIEEATRGKVTRNELLFPEDYQS